MYLPPSLSMYSEDVGLEAYNSNQQPDKLTGGTLLCQKSRAAGLLACLGSRHFNGRLAKDKSLAAGLGFEPRRAAPKTAVLPLDDPAKPNNYSLLGDGWVKRDG